MSIRFARLPLAVVLAIALSSCTAYSLLEPAQHNSGGISYTTTIPWNKTSVGSIPNVDVVTLDGHTLQYVYIMTGIDDGATMMSDLIPNMPPFDKSFTSIEVKEFVQATLTARGFQDFRDELFAPETFGGQPGLRWEFNFASKDGLDRKGVLVGAVKDEKLYGIFYNGAAIHFFDKIQDEAEQIIRSVRFEDS